jgi:hypothetical protein
MSTLAEAEGRLKSLELELLDVVKRLDELEAQKKLLEQRRVEITGGWRQTGEISLAKLAIRDCAFPIYSVPDKSDTWGSVRRIIAVTEKTITIREDLVYDDRVTRYSRSNGWKVGAKNGCGGSIDVAKALTIWSKHQLEKPSA